jgi:hypothetical protein
VISRFVGWSGHDYFSACRGARTDLNDKMIEYGEPGSFEQHQNEYKGMNLKNSNDTKCN